MDIKYVGTRTQHGCEVVKEVDGVAAGPLDPRLDLWRHSADFEWGVRRDSQTGIPGSAGMNLKGGSWVSQPTRSRKAEGKRAC
jgi:hypothetical protein